MRRGGVDFDRGAVCAVEHDSDGRNFVGLASRIFYEFPELNDGVRQYCLGELGHLSCGFVTQALDRPARLTTLGHLVYLF
jgi:hypothetical protein